MILYINGLFILSKCNRLCIIFEVKNVLILLRNYITGKIVYAIRDVNVPQLPTQNAVVTPNIIEMHSILLIIISYSQ
jgi:hypothetical protein